LFFLFLFCSFFLFYSISHLISNNKHKIRHLISQHKDSFHLIQITKFTVQDLHAQSSQDSQHKISQLTVSKVDSHLSHKNNTTKHVQHKLIFHLTGARTPHHRKAAGLHPSATGAAGLRPYIHAAAPGSAAAPCPRPQLARPP
jgi:hypothetical protein